MTAGRGIVHSEMPHGDGENVGLQLWINLKSTEKMVEPAYQELLAKDIPHAEKDGVHVTVIAGESMGITVSELFVINNLLIYCIVENIGKSLIANQNFLPQIYGIVNIHLPLLIHSPNFSPPNSLNS